MDRDLTKDISSLTGVSEGKLNNLTKACIYSICDTIAENINLKEKDFSIELLFGSICCHMEDEENITFRFVPSNVLVHNIEKVLLKKENPLIYDIEQSVTKRILKDYKELF